LKKTTRKAHPVPGVWGRLVGFMVFLEQIPYGASRLSEKRAARGVLVAGTLVMALGAALFTVGWWARLTPLVETAFIIALVGWMMVILGFAFGFVGWAAHKVPALKRQAPKSR